MSLLSLKVCHLNLQILFLIPFEMLKIYNRGVETTIFDK